ncbi:class I SAM-dependent methyltransferase [Paraflavitalea speifideaquila]|uniref:class I SAM-dependent methyltransferase n=1 Tax=Paraflavitalea speifideaquila TaxID=3076558 RepID=UPI0028EAC0C0|nr:class I SAM-dependent methyltransferase [Paraflavitalea speifideiaquila]
MKLLKEHELIWSDIVANNNMNRKRKASGVNSYEKNLKFKPEVYLNGCLEQQEQIKWLDLCCGEGNALLQYAHELAGRGMQDRARLRGIDLVNQFQPVPAWISCLQWETGSLVDWTADDQYDLITCVHGLHYIGDKLKVITEALKAISPKGMLIANLDLKSIKVEGDADNNMLKRLFGEYQVEYNVRRKIISCNGPRDLVINLTYKGADDQAGPNYTGQNAVDAYYHT